MTSTTIFIIAGAVLLVIFVLIGKTGHSLGHQADDRGRILIALLGAGGSVGQPPFAQTQPVNIGANQTRACSLVGR